MPLLGWIRNTWYTYKYKNELRKRFDDGIKTVQDGYTGKINIVSASTKETITKGGCTKCEIIQEVFDEMKKTLPSNVNGSFHEYTQHENWKEQLAYTHYPISPNIHCLLCIKKNED